MKTMREAITDTRRLVYGSMSEQINLLSAPYAAGDTRLTFELDTAQIQPSMILACGLNEWWVKEIDNAAKTAFVVPRWNGSYDAAMPAGSIVMIRPRATDWQLFGEVNRAIVSMSSRTKGLYAPRVAPVIPVDTFGEWGTFKFEASDAMSILAVRVKEPWGGSGGYRTLQDRDWRWLPESGHLRIINRDWGWVRDVEVVYRGRFKPCPAFIDLDIEAECGLLPSMTDIPSLGAAANLLLTTEGRRGQIAAQGDPRRAEEVVQGHNSSAAREMRRRFDDRCDDEAARLLSFNPYRISI